MTVDDIVDGMEGYLNAGSGTQNRIATIEGLELIHDLASQITGLLIAIIIIGLPLVIAIEVAYINFPIIQGGYDNLYHRLKGKTRKAFGLVIRDARKAVEDSHTIRQGTSVNLIYLRIKIKAVFFAVLLVAMTLGPGEFLIEQALVLANNVLTVLFSKI